MTTQATSTAGLPLRRKAARVPVLIATLILSILSYQLNASLFSAALPAMAAHFQESTENVAKVQSLFFLTGAVLGMAFSRWSDFLGRRRTLLIVLSMMLCGTVLCLWAPNLTILLVGRVLQSATSATFTISFLLLSERFSKRLFGISVGVISAVNGGIGGLDGFLGGFITDTIGWQFLFVLVLGVGVLAIVLVAVVVPKRAARTREGRMDWWGAGTLGTFLVLLSNLIGQASTSGWGDIWTLGYLAGAVIAGLAFVAVEKRVARPLIAIEQLRSRQVWPVLASTVLTLGGIFSALNFTVILLSQDAHAGYGLSASMSALLYLTPTAFVGVLAAVFSGWFAQRIGWFKALRISSADRRRGSRGGNLCRGPLDGLRLADHHGSPLSRPVPEHRQRDRCAEFTQIGARFRARPEWSMLWNRSQCGNRRRRTRRRRWNHRRLPNCPVDLGRLRPGGFCCFPDPPPCRCERAAAPAAVAAHA
ncbi:uncharacterized MFS-type transporter Rv1250/MT1289 [Arthrobacter sp. Hiyo1]|uniref:MFS transporter n=1 Tax=Arthrobacter sp. Hiyo1 TaxID=1588020 RepID=UPI0006A36340|nr:MFS transporter [Arthrobacter sp. Hiyo1]GAP60255.1 uncharacterized MFS-type transporter Rv1250/MT1289 [Arthrobacter sp. Hiyo1]